MEWRAEWAGTHKEVLKASMAAAKCAWRGHASLMSGTANQYSVDQEVDHFIVEGDVQDVKGSSEAHVIYQKATPCCCVQLPLWPLRRPVAKDTTTNIVTH